MKNSKLYPAFVLGSICLVVALLLSGINHFTAPIIAQRENDSAFDALKVVLPDGANFQPASLEGMPEGVIEAYTADGGSVFRVKGNGRNGEIVLMVGIDTEGKITGTKVISEVESKNYKERVFDILDGVNTAYKDQTNETFEAIIVGGATGTSEGCAQAIKIALQASVILAGGKIDPAEVLEPMITDLAPGFVKPKEIELPEGSKFAKIFKASNDAGFAYIYSDGETGYLILVNAIGACAVYNVDGENVTDEQSALAESAKAHAKANQTSYDNNLSLKVENVFENATDISAVELDSFNTIVSALTFKVEDAVYYAFYSRSVGYKQMDVYIIIDANGAIAKLDVKSLFFDEDYFPNYPEDVDPKEYKDGFVGITSDTWTGEEAMITHATNTSNAVKQATTDAFAAFKLITAQEGGNA